MAFQNTRMDNICGVFDYLMYLTDVFSGFYLQAVFKSKLLQKIIETWVKEVQFIEHDPNFWPILQLFVKV